MYRFGQVILMVAVLAIIALSILLVIGSIDGKFAGGFFVIALIMAGAGAAISKKHRNK